MNLIHENPFRILGVTANASISERKQQANLIAQYLKIGQNAKLEFDISPPLKPIERTKDLIELQGSRIHSTEDKILYSLFWFVQATGVDKVALNHLTKSKDLNKSIIDFEKGCRDFVVSPSTYSAILNHSTLEIIAFNENQNIGKLKSAISNKFNIISEAQTLGLLKDLVAKDGSETSVDKILDLAIPKLKELLSELVPNSNIDRLILQIFKSNKAIYSGLENEVVNSLVGKLNLLIERSGSEREKLLKKEFSLTVLTEVPNLGKDLIQSSKEHLENIKDLIGESDSIYTDALQNVFEEVNYCGVLPFNKWIEKINQNHAAGNSTSKLKHSADLSTINSLYDLAIRNLQGIDIPIKDTLIKNSKGIGEAQLEEYCGFCKVNHVHEFKQVRVQMFKFTNVLQTTYTYFKDGGYAVSCCSSCHNRIGSRSILSFVVAFAVYVLLAIVTSGVSVMIDFFLTRFMLYTWWSRWVKKQLYYSQVGKHPRIRKLIMNEGYQFGKPS